MSFEFALFVGSLGAEYQKEFVVGQPITNLGYCIRQMEVDIISEKMTILGKYGIT